MSHTEVTTRARRHQTGYIFRVKRSWYGRWYENRIIDGQAVRRQHCEKLADYGDLYRTRKDVQSLLDEKLESVNSGHCRPESTSSVADYAKQFFLPWANAELKPSTALGYRNLFHLYIEKHAARLTMRNFRCMNGTNILASIYREHGLSRKSLRNCKGMLSSLFTHAKQEGVIDGLNPMRDAGIPRKAEAGNGTHAYTVEEVIAMLGVLPATSRTAVALMFFCGLRPGEARAAKWSNYDGKTLRIQGSMWRGILGAPKTPESCAPVPVASALREIIDEMPRISEFILAGPSGKPVDLHNLAARVIVPSLERCATCHEMKTKHAKADHEFVRDDSLPVWRGWYALRRGCATLATSLDGALAAKSLLRHANIATTQAHYIKSVPAEAIRAVDKMSALFDNVSASGRPN
ncbi:MAG TPA: hypothetical protein VGS15_00455 [Candidatus Acidoferrales bacterium]|nr:hypothetical protein [Candidatus Acidoferrales bacterium]